MIYSVEITITVGDEMGGGGDWSCTWMTRSYSIGMTTCTCSKEAGILNLKYSYQQDRIAKKCIAQAQLDPSDSL